MPLSGIFIAGQPCFELQLVGKSDMASLVLQLDNFGEYEVMLLPHIASRVDLIPGFFPDRIRLLDGRVITTRRGTMRIRVPWADAPPSISVRIFLHFNVVGHPPGIHGFIGRDLLKGRALSIDYANFATSLA